LKKQHPDLAGKPAIYFQRKKKAYLEAGILDTKGKASESGIFGGIESKLVQEVQANADELILLLAIDMCETVLSQECDAKLKGIPLSEFDKL